MDDFRDKLPNQSLKVLSSVPLCTLGWLGCRFTTDFIGIRDKFRDTYYRENSLRT